MNNKCLINCQESWRGTLTTIRTIVEYVSVWQNNHYIVHRIVSNVNIPALY